MRVTIRGATLAFGDRLVLDRVDAEFPPNTVSALVGPSGSGKSTLLAVIAGHQRLDGGSVTTDPERTDAAVWISQSAHALPARTVLDNVMLGPLSDGHDLASASARATEVLAAVGLDHLAERRVGALSGGERQRVAFARGFTTDRQLLLADEPSAGLDADATASIAALLAAAATRQTVIVATHDPILVDACGHRVDLRRASVGGRG